MTKIWPTFIFPRFAAPYTFAKLPVCALINDPQKNVTDINYDPWPVLLQHKIWPTFNICMTQLFPRLPVRALINDLKKKGTASTRAYDPLFDMTKNWPTFIFPRFAAPYTFAKLPVHALINDPKKKCYGYQLWLMTCFLTTQNLT